MTDLIAQTSSWRARVTRAALLIGLAVVLPVLHRAQTPQPSLARNAHLLEITANISKEAISPTTRIMLRLSRPLEVAEGTLAVFIGQTDVSGLFNVSNRGLSYLPKVWPLPTGENTLTVYLVSRTNDWQEVAQFPLHVKNSTVPIPNEAGAQSSPGEQSKTSGSDRFQIEPSLTVNLKSESTLLYFPDNTRPERLNYLDFTFQGNIKTTLIRGNLNNQNQFDFVGTSYQKEALQFADRNNEAPQIDLSSYLMQFQVRKLKVQLGHHSYGSNRYLIDGFSSRGIEVSIPLGERFDFSFNAANGTSIVGWNNFSGLSRQKHKIVATTVGLEVFPNNRGRLRFEVGGLHGSLLPLNNFNQRAVTDAESSNGFGARVVATDTQDRFRLDMGYGRSRFNNPTDPLLDQGFSVVAVREASRNARYIDFRYQFLKDLSLSKDRKLNVSFAFRHNRVDPLFRSVALFTQGDRLDNQYELTATIGDISAGAVYNRLNDNLDDIPSILKTLTRRSAFNLALPLNSLFHVANSSVKWLPRLSYNYEHTHSFGAFLPLNSDFALSHVPDQASINQSFNAEWQRERLRFGYRFNRSSQDNRQIGRATADFRTLLNAFTVGVTPWKRVELNLDLSSERASNLEVNRLDQTWRTTFNGNFRTTNKSTLSTTISSAFAGDAANTNRSRSADLDLQWTWRFAKENDKWRKFQGQFFIRYANRYTRATDNIFLFKNLTKFQTMSAGVSFTFF